MEKDDEIKGSGNSYTTFERLYDSRLGKWLSVDPLAEENERQSPYCGMDNNPISVIDPDGDDGWDVINGAVIGTLTNLLPAGGVFRDLYTPSNSQDYNNALRLTDNAFMVAAAAGIITGGTMEAGGGAVALAGAVMSATGVGASAGIPTMAAGGATAGTGALIGAGGAYLLANSANNASQGYNRGKTQPKQQTSNSKQVENQSTVQSSKAQGPYKRPSNATNSKQRQSVQNKPCVDCGDIKSKKFADHKEPLVKEFHRTGSIDKTKMRSTEAVQPQCPTCSSQQGAEMSRYSKEVNKQFKK